MYDLCLAIPKRLRMLVSTLVVVVSFVLLTLVQFTLVPYASIGYAIVTYACVWFALLEDIEGGEWYMLFILPVALVVSWYLFYYLTPVRWLTRLGGVGILAITFYSSISVSNILNVAVVKGLPLFQVAITVSQLTQLFVLYLVMQIFFSFSLGWGTQMIMVFLYSTLVQTQHFWAIQLDPAARRYPYQSYSVLNSILIASILGVTSFLPFGSMSVRALLPAGCMYIYSGVVHLHMQKKMYMIYLREYIFAFITLLVIFLLVVKW